MLIDLSSFNFGVYIAVYICSVKVLVFFSLSAIREHSYRLLISTIHIRSSVTRTLIFGVGVLANDRREGKARMGKNRSRTFSRWHPVGTIVRRTSGATSGEEAAILAASISSRAKRGTRVSKHVWYSRWCYFLRLGHGFGRPAHTANCNITGRAEFNQQNINNTQQFIGIATRRNPPDTKSRETRFV